MAYLFALSFVLILYGTLFPFEFRPDAHAGGVVAAFMASIDTRPGRGDLLSNLVLFLPFGFFGLQAFTRRIPGAVAYLLIVGFGAVTSFGIEVAQYYTPSRTTSLYDLVLNILSTLIGATAGRIDVAGLLKGSLPSTRPQSIFPLFMIAAWAGYRFFPYVPTLDFQHFKDAIKPLLVFDVSASDALRHFAMVLGLARLLQATLAPREALLATLLLAFGAIGAKPFTVGNAISPAEVAGTVAAIGLWLLALSRTQLRNPGVAIIFALALLLQGFAPFEFETTAKAFSFVPFGGFEGGSMAVNFQSFLEKVFLYGTLIWLVAQAGARLSMAVVTTFIFVTAIELAQRYIATRTSEITDPLLVAILGIVLVTLEQARHRPTRSK